MYEEMRNAYKVFVGTREGKRPGVISRHDGRIILNWILNGRDAVCSLDSSGQGPMAYSGERSNKSLVQ
jgi:hypothetical protein